MNDDEDILFVFLKAYYDQSDENYNPLLSLFPLHVLYRHSSFKSCLCKQKLLGI
jgi:hypothetical protein